MRRPTIDWRGVACFTAGIVLVMLAFVEAGREAAWSGSGVLGPLAAGALALAAFVAVERRAAEPIVPLGLFASRMLVAAVLTRSLAAMAMFGALAFVPLFVQAVTGASATRSGAVVAPFVLGWVALSATSARLVLRVGYRGVVMAGAACLTGAFLLLARWDSGLSMGGAMRDVLLAGVGMGLVIVPMLIAVQSAVPRSELGIATSVVQFFMSVGGAVGVSVMGAVMSQRLAAGQPLVEALHGVFVTGLVVCVAALGASLLVPPGRARDLARADMRGEPTRAGS
jgi:predicted MFS family arabinose efflux permease